MTATPLAWHEAMIECMACFDAEASVNWRPVVEEDGRLLVAQFMRWTDRADGAAGMVLAPAFTAVPGYLWQSADTLDILYTLATLIGQARGEGDDSLLPIYEDEEGDDWRLIALGLVTSEVNPERALTSTTFFLNDRMGNFYTRRFMGGNQGEPEVSFGNLPVGIPTGEAEKLAAAHPKFHPVHAGLSTVLHACLATEERCRELFGPNEYRAVAEALEMIGAILDTTHPMNPRRAN